MFNRTNIWWRPIPQFESCQIEGTAETPAPVLADSVMVLEDPSLALVHLGDSQYAISFSVVWDPPLERYGAEEYEVYVGNQPVIEGNSTDFIATTKVRKF